MGIQTLRVGYRPTPGLIWPAPDNSHRLSGFEYDLLQEIARSLDLQLEFVCVGHAKALVDGICASERAHGLDAAVGGIQGSFSLEQKLDILFPHLRNSTVLLVKKSMRHWVRAALQDLFTSWVSRALLWGGLLFCYFPAVLTALVEVGVPDSSFESASGNLFLTAAWYAVVTISTVGYGDLSPVTAAGRLLAAPMIAFAPLLYVGLVQQLWLTFKNAFFRAQYLNGDALKAGGRIRVAAVLGTDAYQVVHCKVGCSSVTELSSYAELLEVARQASDFDVLVVDAPVAAYLLDLFPMKWSLGQQIDEGLGYSCLVPEKFDLEEAMRRLIFSFHENGTLNMLRNRHFQALNQ